MLAQPPGRTRPTLPKDLGMSDTLTPQATKQGSMPPPGAHVPKHGAGWLKPVQKGDPARNPNGNRGSDYVETLRLARQAAPDAMRKLIAKMDSPDDRVAVVAQQAVLERAFGKPREYDPKLDRSPMAIDVSVLSVAEQRMLLDFLRRRLVKEAPPGGPSPDIEGAAEK